MKRNRDIKVIRLRDEGFTLQQVADMLNISTKERVRQIEAKMRRKSKL